MGAGDQSILVRSVNWLGDAVMSTPGLIRLRQARPGARITLLTPEKLAGLWQSQPYLDEVLTFGAGESVWRVGRRLREKRFSVGLAFPNSLRSALELWLARIPQRIGAGGRARQLFLTDVAPPRPGAVPMRKRSPAEIRRLVAAAAPPSPIPPSAHHVHHYLHLASVLGASTQALPPRLEVAAGEIETARLKFGLIQSGPWLGLNPGAEYGPAKRWPAERFVETAALIRQKFNWRIVIFGGPGDRALADQIARGIGEPVVNLAGKTTLRELAAVMKLCQIVLTNDSGPMHLAAAVGARVLAIFGSTSPELTGPLGGRVVRQAPPCAPCFLRECPIDLRCLRAIEVQRVVDELSPNN